MADCKQFSIIRTCTTLPASLSPISAWNHLMLLRFQSFTNTLHEAVYNHWTGLVDWTGGLDYAFTYIAHIALSREYMRMQYAAYARTQIICPYTRVDGVLPSLV